METKVELQRSGSSLRSPEGDPRQVSGSGGSPSEVADCLVKSCALYPFRIGRNPWRAQVSEAQRAVRRRTGQKAAARLRKPTNGIGSAAMDGMAATSSLLPLPMAAKSVSARIAGRMAQHVGVHGEAEPCRLAGPLDQPQETCRAEG